MHSEFRAKIVDAIRVKGLEDSLVGCTDEEILEIQHGQQVSYLPPIYVEFLKIAGKDEVKLWQPEYYTYRYLVQMKAGLQHLLKLHGNPIILPDDAFVMMTTEGIVYYYFLTAQYDSDPRILYFNEYEFQSGEMEVKLSEFLPTLI